MFSSNQVLEISGDKKEQLAKAVKFILDYDGKDVINVHGMKEINGKLIFGWIPKDKNGTFKEEYKKEWDKVFDNTLPLHDELLVEIIWGWLNRQDETYKAIYDEEGVGYWDTSVKGFLISAYNEQTDSYPFSAIFAVMPFYSEYLD